MPAALLLCTRLLWQGPDVCTPDRAVLPCACSECMEWDLVAGATAYQVIRDGKLVGVLEQPVDEEGNVIARTIWCPAKDATFPTGLHSYRVRSCNAAGCGEQSNQVQYDPAPYQCWDDGKIVPCAPSDVCP